MLTKALPHRGRSASGGQAGLAGLCERPGAFPHHIPPMVLLSGGRAILVVYSLVRQWVLSTSIGVGLIKIDDDSRAGCEPAAGST